VVLLTVPFASSSASDRRMIQTLTREHVSPGVPQVRRSRLCRGEMNLKASTFKKSTDVEAAHG
jgi:hypothetical protein